MVSGGKRTKEGSSMYPLKFLIKCVLVGAFGVAGVLALSRGFGLPIPFLEYGALEAWNVLVGAGLIAAGLGIAFFWRLPRRVTVSPKKADEAVRDEWLIPATTTPKAPRGR
jgi:hypothetical protein